MYPTLLRIGDFTLSGYYTMAVLGVVIGFFFLDREAKRQGLDRRIAFNSGIYAAIFGYLGARIQHIIFDGFFEIYLQKPIAMLYFWKGGLAFYGAIVLGSAAIVFYVASQRRPVVRYLDLYALPCAFGLVMGRIGCYLNGCCFGKISAGPLGGEFVRNGLSAKKQFAETMISNLNDAPYPVIQTQLIEALFGFLLFLFLFFIRRRVKKPGVMFGGWLIGYAVIRFIIEIFRDDDRGLFFGGLLSTSQLIAIGTIVLGALLCYLPAEDESKPVAPPPEEPR